MEELIKVNCVSEFVENVIEHHSKTKNSIESNVSCDSFYRGHSNISWPLIPYLYRSNLFHKERVLISEFRRLRPEDFSGLSEFEMLVKMQHFGLPTRLLDVTYNPLVALYFACCENGSDMSSACDGVVHSFFSVPTFWQENYAIRLIMRYVFECAGFKLDFRNFLKILLEDPVISSVFHQSQAFEETVIHYLSRVPCMAVRPALSNTRIVQQDGAFFCLE